MTKRELTGFGVIASILGLLILPVVLVSCSQTDPNTPPGFTEQYLAIDAQEDTEPPGPSVPRGGYMPSLMMGISTPDPNPDVDPEEPRGDVGCCMEIHDNDPDDDVTLMMPSSPGAGGGGCGTCGGSGGGGVSNTGPINIPIVCPPDFVTPEMSFVDNSSYNYHHQVTDVTRVGYSTVMVNRYMRSRDLFLPGSFGYGAFASTDYRLRLGIETVTDPSSGSDLLWAGQFHLRMPHTSSPMSFDFVDQSSSQTEPDNLFVPRQSYWARKLEIFDDEMDPVENDNTASEPLFPGARYALLTDWDHNTFLFELINAETVTGWDAEDHHPVNGRLVAVRDRNDRGFDITYKEWTGTEITESPSRQWQIDQIDDLLGRTVDFTYHSTQQGGNWVVSQIDDNVDMTTRTWEYSYTEGLLSSIVHPDESESSFEVSGSESMTFFYLNMVDFSAPHPERVKIVALTGTVEEINSELVPTEVGNTRAMLNGLVETVYLSFDEWVYAGGGKLYKALEYNSGNDLFYPRHYRTDGWEMEVTESGGVHTVNITGGTEENASYTLAKGGDGVNMIDLATARHTEEQTPEGLTRTHTYDSAKNRTSTLYSDGTFEAFAFDSNNKIVRKRNRLGQITLYTYDSKSRLLTKKDGVVEESGTPTSHATYMAGNYRLGLDSEEASIDEEVSGYVREWFWTYNTTGNGKGLVATATDPLDRVTTYTYDSSHRMTAISFPTDSGSPAVTRTYTYDDSGRLETITEPGGDTVEYIYDDDHRLISTLYDDATTEQRIYEDEGSGIGLLVKTIDRMGVVDHYAYDNVGRLSSRVQAAGVMVSSSEVATDELASTTQYLYMSGTNKPREIRVNGGLTEQDYDYKGRGVATRRYPRDGQTLETTSVYVNNRLFSSTDPYGRNTYYGYDSTDNRVVKTINGTTPDYTLANFAAVASATRDTSPNADYVIQERTYDALGRMLTSVDPRAIETEYEYDVLGRQTARIDAEGTDVESRTETDYDLINRTVEVRSPRYFDSSDANGEDEAKETFTYNVRGMRTGHAEAPGSAVAASESYTFDLKGRPLTHTDYRGKVWTNHYDSCCDKSSASENPLGHGSIRNTDSLRRVVHSATVKDLDDHLSDLLDPVDAKTLAETTTRYDGRGRVVASTVWLVALDDAVDVDSPQIAGLDMISQADGLTTQYLYDDNLFDDEGLDSSTGVTPLIPITDIADSPISLSAAITKLAAAENTGGADIEFSEDAPGRAVVVISPTGEISFTISDAVGRTVMSGRLDNDTGTPGTLLTWSCTLHDTLTELSGFGDLLETRSIDALGKVTKTLADGAGRTLRSIDQLGKVTQFTYDAAGNQLSVRDPNSVGVDVVYDELGRATETTDTESHTTETSYDLAGNRIAATDAKSETTGYIYDARGRQVSQTDRLSAATSFTYLATGQLASLTDAQSQTTSYTYDDAGGKLTEQYPDHTGGSPGDSSYGIVTFVLDAAGRVMRKQDQKGDTCTYNYDLAGRLSSRDYRLAINSPSSAIADTDSFTYDKSGRMLTAVSGRYSNTVTYTYDSAGRKKTEALTISGQTYTTEVEYNARGELISYDYPDGSVIERTYTDRGELYQIKHNSTTIDTRGYDDGGRMTSSSYNNTVSESRGYNDDNTLASITFSGASIGNMTYTWDANKNKTAESITGTMANYGFSIPTGGYDAEDRLVEYERTSGLDQSWSLSAVGDWSSVTTNSSTQTRSYSAGHKMSGVATSGQPSSTVEHDVKGNVTLIEGHYGMKSDDMALFWDFDNRMSSADSDNDGFKNVIQKFDALGRRVSHFDDDSNATTIFLQFGQQTICDYAAGASPSTSKYRYLYGSYIDEPVMRWETAQSDAVYYHRNGQYSIVAVTDDNGAIIERYSYTAYGDPAFFDGSGSAVSNSQISNRLTYTGREYDSTIRLYHYRARMYDPQLGRFLSRDPIGYLGQSVGLYLYTFANPVRWQDFSGLCATGIFSRPTDDLGEFVNGVPYETARITVTVCADVSGCKCKCSEGADAGGYWSFSFCEGTINYTVNYSAIITSNNPNAEDPSQLGPAGLHGILDPNGQWHQFQVTPGPGGASVGAVVSARFSHSGSCDGSCDTVNKSLDYYVRPQTTWNPLLYMFMEFDHKFTYTMSFRCGRGIIAESISGQMLNSGANGPLRQIPPDEPYPPSPWPKT